MYIEPAKDGGFYRVHGDLGPHCKHCLGVGDFLCDFPVGEGKTCDAPLCELHSTEIAHELHYCPAHLAEWEKFKAEGGVQRGLENVIPYRR